MAFIDYNQTLWKKQTTQNAKNETPTQKTKDLLGEANMTIYLYFYIVSESYSEQGNKNQELFIM